MKENQKVLIIGFVWPEPNSSAAGLRMLQLIELFSSQGWSITFASASMESDYMIDLSALGIRTEKLQLNSESFDEFLRQLDPSIVLFDRFMIEEQFGWRVALHCPNALRILDTEDLHSLRASRQKAFKEKRVFETEDILIEEIAKREVASILRCDLTLMVSEYEINILRTVFKIEQNLLYYLPIFAEWDENRRYQWKIFEEKKNFMFIGNFLHEPNWNSVGYLKEEIWPLIKKKLPEAMLQIYGAYPSQKVYQLHNEKEGFIVKGRTANAQEVFNDARVLLAPLRFGAGIKGKLLEAMVWGLPSVTTSIGAEAMNGDLKWSGYIRDNVETYTQAAVDLYTNKQIWNEARENGVEIVKARYQKDSFEYNFIGHILKIQEGLLQHRKHNFLGALLQHHTLKSTEYMARWIEAKNKN